MAFIGKTRDYLLHLGADESTFHTARILRHSMTNAEKLLWDELKSRKLNGLKFRRQHPVHRYIADFYCHEIRLVIEIDGEIHLKTDKKEHDENRSAELDRLGIGVIRFTNDQIQNSLPVVLDEIIKFTANQRNKSSGLTKKWFLLSRRGSLMNRRVPQRIDNMNFNSAKLSVKLSETLRDIMFLYFLIIPAGG